VLMLSGEVDFIPNASPPSLTAFQHSWPNSPVRLAVRNVKTSLVLRNSKNAAMVPWRCGRNNRTGATATRLLDLIGLRAARVTTSTEAPLALPISARASGVVIEMRPALASASGCRRLPDLLLGGVLVQPA